jgi:hypothetical protein
MSVGLLQPTVAPCIATGPFFSCQSGFLPDALLSGGFHHGAPAESVAPTHAAPSSDGISVPCLKMSLHGTTISASFAVTGFTRDATAGPNGSITPSGSIDFPSGHHRGDCSDSAGIVSSGDFGYDGSYVARDTIQPEGGYWVKVRADGRLVIR